MIATTFCQDCGQEVGRPSNLMRHECPIGLARQARLSDDPIRVAPPSRLFALCHGDGRLYNHALREAGHIVLRSTGKPEDPCRVCGWSPSTETHDQSPTADEPRKEQRT